MRTFDEFEKSILRKLKYYLENRIYQNFLSLIDSELTDKKISIDIPTRKVTISFDYDKFYNNSDGGASNLVSSMIELTLTLTKTIFLLNYLEKDSYLFLFDEGNNVSPIELSRISSSKRPIPYDIPDGNICNLISEYATKTIMISQSIIDLVNDNFVSKEDKRHLENIQIAKDNLNEAHQSVILSEKSITKAEESLKLSQNSIKISEDNLIIAKDSIKVSEANLEEAKKDVKTGRIGVGVAIVIGVASIVMSTISIRQTNQTSEKPTLIDSIQYERLLTRIDSLTSNQILLNQTADFIKNKPNIDLNKLYLKLDNIKKEIKKLETIKPSR